MRATSAKRDGCDLNSAEGRAHMASNAKPLWELLPAGALKQQLLGDIADLVQLATRELKDIWFPSEAKRRGSARYDSGYSAEAQHSPRVSSRRAQSPAPQRSSGAGAQPTSRADHAARLLLNNLAAQETLTAEDHRLLGELEAPHGPMFAWLESQWHEHGAQPWAALREGLRGQPFEAHALRLMAGFEFGADDNTPEALAELRRLLNRMLIERLKREETQAIAASKSDPGALQRYRELQARRLALEAAV